MHSPVSPVLEKAIVLSAAGLGFYLLVRFWNDRVATVRLLSHLQQAHADLHKEQLLRRSERAGRIKAEQELRKRRVTEQAAASGGNGDVVVYPFKPIGYLRSCFSQRNGTPRQPLLVPAARARLELSPDVPPSCLDGLQHFSHCWIIYVFHCNTDLPKSLGADRANVKAKVRVPRLDGGRSGVLATRTPHRPCPIGLSTAQVLHVENGVLILGGADVVDGSPVLDIKPYLPFCDSLPSSTAPHWVKAEAEEEPLHVAGTVFTEEAGNALRRCWEARRKVSLYPDAASFLELVQEVLSRDIRSVHQRLHQHDTRQALGKLDIPDSHIASAAAWSGGASQQQEKCFDDGRRVGEAGGESEGGDSSAGKDRGAGERLEVAESRCGQLDMHVGRSGNSEGGEHDGRKGRLQSGKEEREFHVVLDGIDVSYCVGVGGVVQVMGAVLSADP